MTPSQPRERLLAAAVEQARQGGIADLSLRELAAAIGTSHRMLLYHFGSREGLLVAIARAVEEAERATLLDWGVTPEDARRFWARISDPAMWPAERLFFELYVQALFGRLGDDRLVLGLPGNPGSAMVCAELFLKPLLRLIMGADPIPTFLKARLAAPLGKNGPREQLMRVLLSHDETGQLWARAPFDQDSSLVTVFAQAEGLMRRPAQAPPAEAGQLVNVLSLARL